MQQRERKLMESYLRVQAFLSAYPAPEPLSYADAKATLDQVLERAAEFSRAQAVGRNTSLAASKRLRVALRQLRQRHLRPIVAIAQAHRALMPGIEKALRMPRHNMNVLGQLVEGRAIRDAVAAYDPVFVRYGRPADFIAQLSAAMVAVESAVAAQVAALREKVQSRKGIVLELRRGRGAVNMLDSIVRVAWEGNEVALRAWENARRIRGLPVRDDASAVEDQSITPIAA